MGYQYDPVLSIDMQSADLIYSKTDKDYDKHLNDCFICKWTSSYENQS